ncbi:unnamed protein product [Hymenolepis diminuta]|uniref:HELICc2 domain-containing protein n=1 Tax=Hymenolepis diminuta TaxID=6216 RepID=A0A0R3SVS6_HYMDI|nr:unnamed protein product [Hymenolepis diminuta]VUZ52163.1 unnamed protein product [Hymenolepis diminuta]
MKGTFERKVVVILLPYKDAIKRCVENVPKVKGAENLVVATFDNFYYPKTLKKLYGDPTTTTARTETTTATTKPSAAVRWAIEETKKFMLDPANPALTLSIADMILFFFGVAYCCIPACFAACLFLFGSNSNEFFVVIFLIDCKFLIF